MIARSLVSGSEPKVIKIFYSYSRRDHVKLEEIDRKLAEFKWDVMVEPWYDGNIPPGNPWDRDIHYNLNAADIILLFVTNSFMTSPYCRDVEVPLALRRHEDGEARVIPILLEETDPDWHKAPFAKLQALPQNGLPVNVWPDPQEALTHVAQGLVNIITQQGIQPQPKYRWKLYLEGDLNALSVDDKYQIISHLRDFSGDNMLRPVEVRPGSISLVIESSADAFYRVDEAFRRGELSKLLKWNIIKIVSIFGAGIRMDTRPLEAGIVPQPANFPSPDMMLFPGERSHHFALMAVTITKSEPFDFKFITNISNLRDEGKPLNPSIRQRLIDHFFTGLSECDDDMWVNLAPDDRNHMLPPSLSGTTMGRVMLETDYNLKRLSSSLLHPNSESGNRFWTKVFAGAQKQYNATSLPYASFLRVWIVPDQITVLEAPQSALIKEATLKVLSEKDYLPTYSNGHSEQSEEINRLCYSIFNETVLPIIDEEVREGAIFAPIREIYCSLILARWCKQRFVSEPGLQQFVAQNKKVDMGIGEERDSVLSALDIPENREYFGKYIEIFRSGVFYTVRDDYDPFSCQKITRAYFSGAIDLRSIGRCMKVETCRGIAR